MTVSWSVTLYKLVLGDPDTETGHFGRGYTEHAITMAIFPKGTPFSFGSLGWYTKYDFTGYTAYSVADGDVVKDSFGRIFTIKSNKDWTVGDQFAFRECELESTPYFSLPTGATYFFGFEVIDDDHKFEDGFERGYWSEIIY